MAASETIHLLELSKFENDCKTFQWSSEGALLEKVIRKNYETFRHKTSMRNPLFSKSTCSSTKKEFLHILLLWKFRKMSRKKPKTFRKIINRACFDEYFHRFTFRNNLFQNALSRCIMWNPLEDIFHSVHVWYDEAILV